MTDATTEQMLSDSKLVGCMIRGLPSSTLECDTNKFKYINSLDRKYVTDRHNISSVKFNISRYGKYNHVIKFPILVCERDAIEKVEEYLSKPLTEKFYNKIVDDLFHESPWATAEKWFTCRGDCLTDAKFLEETYVTTSGVLTFFIGS
jgi:hypothetical protein